MPEPKFKIGDTVYKWTGDYTGPGVVRGTTVLPNGKLRYLVGHTIERGSGEFLHIHAEGNLRKAEDWCACGGGDLSGHDASCPEASR